MRSGIALGALLFLTVGCSTLLPSSGTVEIRVSNASAVALDEVIVRFPDQQEVYGSIAPSGHSDYRRVDQAYRYAYVEAKVGGEKVVLQPIDYVGEALLSEGRYSYVLGVTTPDSHLTLSLIRDD
jgi:hypothetical protein